MDDVRNTSVSNLPELTSNIYDSKTNDTNEDYYDYDETGSLVQVTAFPILIVLGTAGNISAFIVMRRGSLKDVSTCFYMSVLALADTGILWTMALQRFILHLTEFRIDIYTWTDCTVGILLFYFFSHYSSALLATMSVEKFIALYFPFKTKSICTVKTAKWASGISGFLLFVFNFHVAFMVKETNFTIGKMCQFVGDNYMLFYFTADSILYSFAPSTVMIFANLAIIYKFMQAKLKSVNEGTQSTNQALSKSAMKGTAMLITVSLTFILLTAPVVILYVADSHPDPLVSALLTLLQHFNHSINGILYCIVGSRFRNELLNMLCCGKHSKRKSRNIFTTENSAKSMNTSNTELSN